MKDTIYHEDPLMNEIDVIGLYPADVAAVSARVTLTDPGSGGTRTDD